MMNTEKQRIVIAEACGWKCCRTEQGHLAWGVNPETGYQQKLPSYLVDLNAMHEAELLLPKLTKYPNDVYKEWVHQLWAVVRGRHAVFSVSSQVIGELFADATATQRAEAFLRTLNLWAE